MDENEDGKLSLLELKVQSMLLSDNESKDFHKRLEKFSGFETNVDIFCSVLGECKSDNEYLLCLCFIPRFLSYRKLEDDEISKIIAVFPINLIDKFIRASHENCDITYESVVNILSVLLARCSEDDNNNFRSLFDGLLAFFYIKKCWTLSLLENAVFVLENLWDENVGIENVTKVLTIISGEIKRKQNELPPIGLLKCIMNFVQKLLTCGELSVESYQNETWPINIRIIIKLLIQNRLEKEYECVFLIISSYLISLIGVKWFDDDPTFAILLSATVYIHLQVNLNSNGSDISPNQYSLYQGSYFHCAKILHSLIFMAEDSEFLVDDKATQLAKGVQECLSLIIMVITECDKSDDFKLNLEAKIAFCELICCYFSFGGYLSHEKKIINNLLPSLLNIAESAQKMGNVSLVSELTTCLSTFESLPERCLSVLMNNCSLYDQQQERDKYLAKLLILFEELKIRKDWFRIEDLLQAITYSKEVSNQNLLNALLLIDDISC